LGWLRRTAALILYLSLILLLGAHSTLKTPETNLIVWLIFALILIPRGEKLSIGLKSSVWRIQPQLAWGFWLVVMCSYTVSAYLKLNSGWDGWWTGRALDWFLNGMFTRHWIQEVGSSGIASNLRQVLSFLVIAIEGLPLLTLVSQSTMIIWCWFALLMQVGILLTLEVTQLSLGMILVHLFLLQIGKLSPIINHNGPKRSLT
jgi:hypothetical protein